MPIIGPEQKRAQRGGQATAAHARAHANAIAALSELWFDQHRPALNRAQVHERLLKSSETFLIATAHVAHEVPIAYGVVIKFAPQRQIHDIGIEPEAPLALDVRVQVDGERYTVVQCVAYDRVHRVVDARVQQEHASLYAYIGGADLQHPIERVGMGRGDAQAKDE